MKVGVFNVSGCTFTSSLLGQAVQSKITLLVIHGYRQFIGFPTQISVKHFFPVSFELANQKPGWNVNLACTTPSKVNFKNSKPGLKLIGF